MLLIKYPVYYLKTGYIFKVHLLLQNLVANNKLLQWNYFWPGTTKIMFFTINHKNEKMLYCEHAMIGKSSVKAWYCHWGKKLRHVEFRF